MHEHATLACSMIRYVLEWPVYFAEYLALLEFAVRKRVHTYLPIICSSEVKTKNEYCIFQLLLFLSRFEMSFKVEST